MITYVENPLRFSMNFAASLTFGLVGTILLVLYLRTRYLRADVEPPEEVKPTALGNVISAGLEKRRQDKEK